MQVLVINSGSSSVKFELFSVDPELSLLRGEVERIGGHEATLWVEKTGTAEEGAVGRHGLEHERRAVAARDHGEALDAVMRALGEADPRAAGDIVVVGHRVVHGGDRFSEPVVIDDSVLEEIRSLALLAPVHTKANVAGIESARSVITGVPHVAVFDTAFHRTIPPRACEYALPRDLAREHRIRRYGFHGTSHAYVARRAAVMLDRPLEELDLITMHLGNGASVTAIHGGRSIDTSMGMTPLEGLVMGTRCGDLDPAVPMLLGEITGRSREEVHRLMNFESGLKGLCGDSDMREVHRRAGEGDPDAQLAVEMFCYRARKYVGAYYAVLGRADAVVFTAGIGENDPEVRSRVCSGLERLGIEIDPDANAQPAREPRAHDAPAAAPSGAALDLLPGERFVSAQDSPVAVLVIPTDEELEIARQAYVCVTGREDTLGVMGDD